MARLYMTDEDSFGWFIENPTVKSRLYDYFVIFREKTPVLTLFTE